MLLTILLIAISLQWFCVSLLFILDMGYMPEYHVFFQSKSEILIWYIPFVYLFFAGKGIGRGITNLVKSIKELPWRNE